MTAPLFLDRPDAGRHLARTARATVDIPDSRRAVVVAVARSGLPVALEVADMLGLDLDVLQVRRITAPGARGATVGAITRDGIASIDGGTVDALGLSNAWLHAEMHRLDQEIDAAQHATGVHLDRLPIENLTAVLVDDGVVTGMTAIACCWALRTQGARRVVLATPVASARALPGLRMHFDQVVCESTALPLRRVGDAYLAATPLDDADVDRLLGARVGARNGGHS